MDAPPSKATLDEEEKEIEQKMIKIITLMPKEV
jgi:hypothetical protein